MHIIDGEIFPKEDKDSIIIHSEILTDLMWR